MSLSERLKVAERARRRSTGDVAPEANSRPEVTLDLSSPGAAVVDLTDLAPAPTTAIAPEAPLDAISYSPMRNGDGSSAFTDVSPATRLRTAGIVCPRCGGATQLDLFDQVHNTASLSCSSCFHMFRVELTDPAT